MKSDGNILLFLMIIFVLGIFQFCQSLYAGYTFVFGKDEPVIERTENMRVVE